MARGGHRYTLLLYAYTLNRWWKPVLWIGFLLILLAGGLFFLPGLLPQFNFPYISDTMLFIGAGAGGLAILLGFFILLMRRSAYIRPMRSHVHLATPLLSLNISYKRIRQASSVEMGRLFPPERYKGWKRKFLLPIAGQTAVVLDMNGWPMSPGVLKMFLSPFFFPDRTARLALLVGGWMDFSTEMESFRGAWLDAQRQTGMHTPQSDLLASLSKSKH
jgi:hypothetical protein